jgi:hypothetical protein
MLPLADRYLGLGHNRITAVGLSMLLRVLQHQHLLMQQQPLQQLPRGGAAVDVSSAISNGDGGGGGGGVVVGRSSLRALVLSGNNRGDQFLATLAPALAVLPGLRVFVCDRCGVTDAGVAAIVHALQGGGGGGASNGDSASGDLGVDGASGRGATPALEELHLRENDISDDGAAALVTALGGFGDSVGGNDADYGGGAGSGSDDGSGGGGGGGGGRGRGGNGVLRVIRLDGNARVSANTSARLQALLQRNAEHIIKLNSRSQTNGGGSKVEKHQRHRGTLPVSDDDYGIGDDGDGATEQQQQQREGTQAAQATRDTRIRWHPLPRLHGACGSDDSACASRLCRGGNCCDVAVAATVLRWAAEQQQHGNAGSGGGGDGIVAGGGGGAASFFDCKHCDWDGACEVAISAADSDAKIKQDDGADDSGGSGDNPAGSGGAAADASSSTLDQLLLNAAIAAVHGGGSSDSGDVGADSGGGAGGGGFPSSLLEPGLSARLQASVSADRADVAALWRQKQYGAASDLVASAEASGADLLRVVAELVVRAISSSSSSSSTLVLESQPQPLPSSSQPTLSPPLSPPPQLRSAAPRESGDAAVVEMAAASGQCVVVVDSGGECAAPDVDAEADTTAAAAALNGVDLEAAVPNTLQELRLLEFKLAVRARYVLAAAARDAGVDIAKAWHARNHNA